MHALETASEAGQSGQLGSEPTLLPDDSWVNVLVGYNPLPLAPPPSNKETNQAKEDNNGNEKRSGWQTEVAELK